jgi:NAD(P)-dependent dehydrogenase (short-subunit alcohol dehydrogenase family)
MSVLQNTRKAAAIMGVAMGIGEAIVRALAAENYAVTILDRDGRCHALAEELRAHGAAADSAQVDITDEAGLHAAMDALRQRIGAQALSAAVNAAGIFDERGGLRDTSLPSFRQVMEVNVTGAFLFSKIVEPLLAPNAALIHISSINALRAGGGLTAYKTSKAALNMLTRCLALELARDPRRIRVNVVAPGWVDTPGERKVVAASGKPQVLDDPETGKWIPLGRRQTAAEIAAGVVFLCSEKANMISGQVLGVDGGMSA